MKKSINESELSAIEKMLKNSIDKTSGINYTSEIIWTAFQFLRKNPNETIENACNMAIKEWIG